MELNRLLACAAGALILLTSPTLFASHPENGHPHQFEAIIGVNHSYNSFSHLHLGEAPYGEEDALHSTSFDDDFIWGAAYGYNILSRPNLILQHVILGLDMYFYNTEDSGETYQYVNKSMNNYEYEAYIQTARLMVNSELDFQSPWEAVFPFFQMSLGASRVTMDYHDTPKNEFVGGGGVSIEEGITYNFTYSVGAGLKFQFTPNIIMTASYLYTDFGNVKTADDILENNLWTSSGLFSFTYLFG